jgi:predicted outer membrane protein
MLPSIPQLEPDGADVVALAGLRHDLPGDPWRSVMNWKRWAAATVTSFAIPATAQTRSPAQSGGANSEAAREAERDAVLLSFIHHANQREIELAKLAKEKSNSPQVKAFADRLLADHQAADDRLATFAKGRGVDLDAVRAQVRSQAEKIEQERRSRAVGSASGEWAFMAEPDMDRETARLAARLAMAEYSSSLAELRLVTGASASRQFVQAVIKDHRMVIDRVTHARSRIVNAEVASFVDKLLPTFKQHLTMAQELQDRLSQL